MNVGKLMSGIEESVFTEGFTDRPVEKSLYIEILKVKECKKREYIYLELIFMI